MLTYTDQTKWSCTNPCIRGVTRIVWDGDQILAEIRAPYTVAEQDLGPVPAATIYRRGYGQVLYTHGPSLDYPIRVTRLSYDSIFPAPIWITPHTNWHGSYDSGEIYNSENGNSCKRVASGARDLELSGETGYGPGELPPPGSTIPDSVTACIQVDWPAPYQWQTKLEHGRSRIGPASWMGSLIEGGRDLTGQLYMRNRFYDPQSGKFTQEDPIGIAGGLNVYGFAGGDPVNSSDPYGLCPPVKDCLRLLGREGDQAIKYWAEAEGDSHGLMSQSATRAMGWFATLGSSGTIDRTVETLEAGASGNLAAVLQIGAHELSDSHTPAPNQRRQLRAREIAAIGGEATTRELKPNSQYDLFMATQSGHGFERGDIYYGRKEKRSEPTVLESTGYNYY